MEGYSALAVANYFLSKHRNTGISPLKIQKLTYIAHGWHLALFGKPLVCDEYAEAWRYGPVFPSVYHEFKYRGGLPIIDLGTDFKLNGKGKFVREVPKIKKGDEETKGLLDRIWEVYGPWSGVQLSKICHQPGTPWEKTWKKSQGTRNTNILNDVIEAYYSGKLKQNKRKIKAEKLEQNKGTRIEKKLNFEENHVDEKEIQSMETSENERFSIEDEFNKARVRLTEACTRFRSEFELRINQLNTLAKSSQYAVASPIFRIAKASFMIAYRKQARIFLGHHEALLWEQENDPPRNPH